MLNVASTSINRKILSVEETLGVKLLSRTSEGVELTFAGTLMLEHCRKTLLDYENVALRINDIREMRSVHINITTIDSVALDLLPRTMLQYERDHPGASFSVLVCPPEKVVSTVATGEADIGMTFVHALHPDVRPIVKKFAPIGIVLRSDHPLSERSSLSMDDLHDYPLIRTPDARGQKSIIDRLVSDAATSLPSSVFTNSLPLAKQMILGGSGVGLYTKLGFLPEIASGDLRFVPLNATELSELQVGVIVTAKAAIDPAKLMMCNAIADKFKRIDLDT